MFFKRKVKPIIRSDEDLLILYKESGDIALLGELFERHIYMVFGIAMKYLKNQEDSKDMTMVVFEKLSSGLIHHEVQNFKSWLHVLTKNQCLMLLRSRKYKNLKDLTEINDDSDVESDFVLHHIEEPDPEQNLQELENAVEHLPPEQKICIKLFYIEEKCYKEVSEITGYDLKKIKSYIQNGKRNLRNHLLKINGQQ
jgi:RNA polymerase sigma factor (sigma-70 family)